jgi:hypothetical protein
MASPGREPREGGQQKKPSPGGATDLLSLRIESCGRVAGNSKFKFQNSKLNRVGGRENRNDMMTGPSDEPNQNVIPTEGRNGASGGICWAGGKFAIPNSKFEILAPSTSVFPASSPPSHRA